VDIKQAIKFNLTNSDFLVERYLADLTPQELLTRPCCGANHIAWQIGHLIASERYLVDKVAPGKMPALPEGFAEKHKKHTAGNDDAGSFLSKEEYLRLRKEVRAATLKAIDELPAEGFDAPLPSGVPPVIKTAGELFLFLGPHWLMHAGQWAVTRRSLGRPPLF
jgi:hypothetical protein